MSEMREKSDLELLRDYSERGHEAAFRELIQRYTDLVFSAALRQTDDATAAADIVQRVFVDLAQKATALTPQSASHASLAGWLHRGTRYLALNHRRDTHRRRVNERQAMEQLLINSEPPADWEPIRPTLDEALDQLSDDDRELLLLRYFKNHDLRTVGATLGISDDAAQKRVSRAVERLREFLAKRGVTVGASSLVAVLTTNAVQAAPIGLALTVSAAATLTGSTLLTTTAIATKAIAMTTLQKTAVTATIAILAGVGIYEARQSSELREQVHALKKENSALTAQLATPAIPYDEAPQTVAAASPQSAPPQSSGDLLRLRGEVARLHRENEQSKIPVTHEAVSARYQTAQELARNGDATAALQEFLWCFDEGMPRVSSFAGVRRSFLLSAITKLGETYPEALTALRERRDQALQRILNSENDPDAAQDFAALNKALKEEPNLLALHDQLPSDDNRRKVLADLAYDQLVAAQRYTDAIAGRPFSQINTLFELQKMDLPLPANTPNLETLQKGRRENLIKTTLQNVEALAGAGDLPHAQQLASQLLAYDNSPQTRTLLAQHVARAGQPGLLDNLIRP